MILNAPNVLTIFRLLAAPGLAFCFLFLGRPWADWAALGLFSAAAITDYADGFLARLWKQESAFGAMLDPIADKAMVLIALMVLTAMWGMSMLIAIPGVIIVFREVFVSGLREYLGDRAGLLKVTRLAKWKTAVQMVALILLFSQALFEHYAQMHSFGMDADIIQGIIAGEIKDEVGLLWKLNGLQLTTYGGLGLLWLASILTAISGLDYFVKSLPLLREVRDEA